MNKENTSKLFQAFPELYKGHVRHLSESLMAFGFECSDGWFDIIWRLSKDITELANKANIEVPEARQVKEKFAELCFYLGKVDNLIFEQVYQLIDAAEEESLKTCERCGEPGKLRSDRSWVLTLCERHALIGQACYRFSLVFRLPSTRENPQQYIDELEGCCDGVLIGVGTTTLLIALNCMRQSFSIQDAIVSVALDVLSVIPNAQLVPQFELKSGIDKEGLKQIQARIAI